MFRISADVQGEPEGFSAEQPATSAEPIAIQPGTAGAGEETTVARQEHADTSADPDTTDDVSGSAAIDRAAVVREKADA